MYFPSILLAAIITAAKAASPPGDGVQLIYRTATITQCVTYNGLSPTIDVGGAATCVVNKPAVTGDPITVEVQAPNCESCGCKTCVQTVVHTTKYDAFCSTGLYEQEYVITETYSGLASKPTMPSASLPFGFTCDVQTCNSCGPEPITATITYPVTDRPYINAVSYPTQKPVAAEPQKGSQGSDGYAKGEEGSESEDGYAKGDEGSESQDGHAKGEEGSESQDGYAKDDEGSESQDGYAKDDEGSESQDGSNSPDVPGFTDEDGGYMPKDAPKPVPIPKADSQGETDSDAHTDSNSSPVPGPDKEPGANAHADAGAGSNDQAASGDNSGFKSSVKPSTVAGPLESSYSRKCFSRKYSETKL
ncbi:hypothetical protein ACHAPJ_003231 [Fusarium lateritium]